MTRVRVGCWGAGKRLSKDAKPDDVCKECTDDRKDKPVLGLEIIRGAKKADGKDVWEGGKILDPRTAATTRCASRPSRAARSWKCVAPSAPSAARRPGSASSNPYSPRGRAHPSGVTPRPNKEPNPCPDSK